MNNGHFEIVKRAIEDGRLVPFLGAGVNLYGRPEEFQWLANRSEYLPNGPELSEHLAENFGFQAEKPCHVCGAELTLVQTCDACGKELSLLQTCEDCGGQLSSLEACGDCQKKTISGQICDDCAQKIILGQACSKCEKKISLQKMCVACGYKSSFGQDKTHNLLHVSQHAAVMHGTGPLYDKLDEIFNADYPPLDIHRFFAKLPSFLRETKDEPLYPLIITTNYDDLLERAFWEAQEPFDVIGYVAEGMNSGKFKHYRFESSVSAERNDNRKTSKTPSKKEEKSSIWPPLVESVMVERPNEYRALQLNERSVILKIHGAVDRFAKKEQERRSSFVITEDHYIDYLTRTDISNLIPVTLAAKVHKSNFLFLGYSLRDWNLRVILHRIWGERRLSYESWAIQPKPEEIEKRFWRKRDVELISMKLEDYTDKLRNALESIDGKETKQVNGNNG